MEADAGLRPIFLIVLLSSIGLPGTNGFVGEFLVLLGAFRTKPMWAALAATGVILSAVYMLWMFQRVMFGPVTHPENEKLTDLTLRERLVFAPLLLLIFWMGVQPQPFIDRMQPALDHTLQLVQGAALTGGGGLSPPMNTIPRRPSSRSTGGRWVR